MPIYFSTVSLTGSHGSSPDPIWVTGSIFVLNPSGGGAGGNVTALSGSVFGQLVGGVPVSSANPIPMTGSVSLAKGVDISSLPNVTVGNTVTVTGSVHMADVSAMTGTVVIGRAIDVATLPSVTVGNTVNVTGSVGLTMGANVTVLSGSVSGLLVGGAPVSSANPVPVTGTISIANVTSVNVTNTPAVTLASTVIGSGSVAGVLYGGVPAGQTNPFWVTGSVFILNQGGAGSNVTALSGSVVGLLVGGVPLAGNNPVPVTGTVALARAVDIASLPNVTVGNTVTVTGSVSLSQGVAVSNVVSVTGTVHMADVSTVTGSVTLASVGTITGSVVLAASPNVFVLSGSVAGLLVGGQPVSNANPIPMTGTFHLADVSTITGSVTLASSPNVRVLSGSIVAISVGGVEISQANPVPVNQLSGSLTGLQVGGVAVSRSNLVPTVKYDAYGAAELSGTFLSQGFAAINSATSGSTTVVTTTVIGRRVTVTSAIVSVGINFPNTTFWLASTSSAGLSNLTGYMWGGSTTADSGRLLVLPYNQNGWFQTGLCQANSTASLLLQSNTTASIGTTVTYFVTP